VRRFAAFRAPAPAPAPAPAHSACSFEIFDELFRAFLPKLHAHFEAENITPEFYFLEWCITLFCKRLRLEVVGRVWDCYLVFGEAFVYRAAVGILAVLQDQLLGKSFEQCMRVLSDSAAEISEQQLFDVVGPIKLSDRLREKLVELQSKDPRAEARPAP
jgi:hypothetical protein